jgi:hypothetical protein
MTWLFARPPHIGLQSRARKSRGHALPPFRQPQNRFDGEMGAGANHGNALKSAAEISQKRPMEEVDM